MEAPLYKLRRYHLLLILCLGNMLAYMTRFATTVTLLATDGLTTSEMAQIESSFFYGYCLSVVPMGFLADKIGARAMIAIVLCCQTTSNWLIDYSYSL